MQLIGEVQSTEIVSHVSACATYTTEPGEVKVVVHLTDTHGDRAGSLTLEMPYNRAKTYPVGRRVNLTIEPQ